MYSVVRLHVFIIDPDKSFVDTGLDLGSRNVGQTRHKEFINADETLFGVSYDSVVLEELVLLVVDEGVNIRHFFRLALLLNRCSVAASFRISRVVFSCSPGEVRAKKAIGVSISPP